MTGYSRWDRDAYIERVGGPGEAERRRKALMARRRLTAPNCGNETLLDAIRRNHAELPTAALHAEGQGSNLSGLSG